VRILFILVPYAFLNIVGGCLYIVVSPKYRASPINLCVVSVGALCGVFLYWAIWLGQLTGTNLSVYIASLLWHAEPGKSPENATRWDAVLIVTMPFVLTFFSDLVLLKVFGKRKLQETSETRT
jgi:hypothetical protein